MKTHRGAGRGWPAARRHPGVGGPLRTAYSHFNQAVLACLEGKSPRLPAELGKAEQKLTSVIYLLKPTA